MRRILAAAALTAALAGLLPAAPVPAAGSATPLVVTPAWLAERLNDPSLVVLQVAAVRDDYARGHIPGARFVWLNWLAESSPERSFEMPPVKALEDRLEQLGVSNGSQVVICHTLGDPTAAARVYLTLDYLGMGERAVILDGGLEAWKREGRTLTQEVPKHKRGKFTPKLRPEVLASLDAIQAERGNAGVRLVDARSAQAFNAPEGVTVVRGGHLPGAVNVPLASVTDSLGQYQPADSLRARFEKAGVKPGDRVITYCGIGRTACPVYVAAKSLGYDVRLYDGSFEEWSRRDDVPVEKAEKK
jgi:thiosulfate/3-mercaptopyruvate sulfurtransferase